MQSMAVPYIKYHNKYKQKKNVHTGAPFYINVVSFYNRDSFPEKSDYDKSFATLILDCGLINGKIPFLLSWNLRLGG